MNHNRKIIYLAGFLFNIPVTLALYINSSFLASFVGEKLVGVVYALASLASILVLLFTPLIYRKVGGYKFLMLVALFDALTFLALTFIKDVGAIMFVFIIGFSLNILIFSTLDEFLKIFSKNNTLGRARGIYLAVSHIALIMTQLSFGIILGVFSFRIIYFISFMTTLLFLVMLFFKLKNVQEPKYDKINTLKYIRKFFRNRNLARGYLINFLLQLFYAWMIIYTPIYLSIHLSFSWREIGFIFAVMLLPFIIIPFHLGKYGDKFGERKMLMLGFAIISLSTLSLFFIGQAGIFLWMFGLFMTRVGAASIEVMSDTYFFKHITPENEEFVNVYRTAFPTAYILGPLVASIIFILIPSFNYIYLILGAIMLSGVYLASTIKVKDI